MSERYEQEISDYMSAQDIGFSELGRRIDQSRKTVFAWVRRTAEADSREVVVVAREKDDEIVEIYSRRILWRK